MSELRGQFESVPERLDEVRSRIAAAGGDPHRVRIVAVTKTFGPAAVAAAVAAGVLDVAENYGRELLRVSREASELGVDGDALCWHLVGPLQRRDVPRLAPLVAVYESVDRIAEGEAIARHAPGATVLVEVDTTSIPGRAGVRVEEVAPLVDALRALGLDVAGCMTIAPPNGGDGARAAFATTRAIVDRLGLPECSMGMSDDLELAVAEGSTAVRVGRALFGARDDVVRVPQ